MLKLKQKNPALESGAVNRKVEMKKPRCKLIGEDGNIFNLIAIASETLEKSGMADKANEMYKRITTEAQSYDEALVIIMEYVEVE